MKNEPAEVTKSDIDAATEFANEHMLGTEECPLWIVEAFAHHRFAAEQADAERERVLVEALQKIASCGSHAKGDVVDIARQALATIKEKTDV